MQNFGFTIFHEMFGVVVCAHPEVMSIRACAVLEINRGRH